MMLTRSMLTPASLADLTTLSPSWVSPSGSTGRVSDTFRPGLRFCNAASAADRRLTEAGSATAAPSMSRSMNFRLYADTTAWYSACNALTSVHAWASSWPVAPPNEIFTSPPCWRIASIWSLNAAARGSNALNQEALQPTAVTNASVNDLTPPADASCWRQPPLDVTPMSTYGATSTPLGPAGGGGAGCVADGAGFVGDGDGGGGPTVAVAGPPLPPPPHGAPLTVQAVGAPLPATMNPKLVDDPAGTVALYPRSVAVTVAPLIVTPASQNVPSFAVAGRLNWTLQCEIAAAPGFVMVNLPW